MNTPERPPQNGKKPPGRRTVTFTLSIPAFISSGLLLCVALVWVFILGIILGRGYAPENSIPELERIMPHSKPGQPAQVVTPREPAAPSSVESSPAGDSKNSEVLTQNELEFHTSLKTRTPRATPAPKTQPPAKPLPDGDRQTAESKPAARQEQPEKPAPRASAQTFDYVYQVAAYKDAPSSDALAAKLKQSGIKARTERTEEKGVVWYRTVISFRGTPDDTEKLRAQLSPHKLTRLILRSKTPAS